MQFPSRNLVQTVETQTPFFVLLLYQVCSLRSPDRTLAALLLPTLAPQKVAFYEVILYNFQNLRLFL